jgi:hypothetical protein
MSINSRGSRKVCLGDEEYAWKLRNRPTDGERAGPMSVAVQRTVPFSPAVLVVDLEAPRAAVTSAVVRQLVTRALADGWRPETGAGHRLGPSGSMREAPAART